MNTSLPTVIPAPVKNNYFDGLPVADPQKFTLYILMLAYFFQQFTNWSFGFLAPAFSTFLALSGYSADAMIGRVLFWYFTGMTAGAFVGGILSDRFGRRKVMLAAMVILSVASIINGAASNFSLFLVARATTGFGVFCLMVVSHAYIAEICPAESRGKWQCLVAAVGFSSAPLAALLCQVTTPIAPESWRVLFFFGGLGLLPFGIALFFLKESPRWLAAQGRVKEAEEIVRELSGYHIDLSDAAPKQVPNFYRSLADIFALRYLKRTLVLALLFSTATPGIFIMFSWTTRLLAISHGMQRALDITMYMSFAVPISCWFWSMVVDKGGRKTPLVLGCLVSSCLILLFAVAPTFVLQTATGTVMNIAYVGLSFLQFVLVAESYPTYMRNTAVGLHNGLGRLVMAALQPAILWASQVYGPFGIFAGAAGLLCLGIPVYAIWGRRTAGVSLEELGN